jgi:hypothetical protein
MDSSSSSPTEKSPSVAVIEAVANETGTDPTGVAQQLYEVVDPDALDALFASGNSTDGTVTFTYCGYTVTVTADSGVTLEER